MGPRPGPAPNWHRVTWPKNKTRSHCLSCCFRPLSCLGACFKDRELRSLAWTLPAACWVATCPASLSGGESKAPSAFTSTRPAERLSRGRPQHVSPRGAHAVPDVMGAMLSREGSGCAGCGSGRGMPHGGQGGRLPHAERPGCRSPAGLRHCCVSDKYRSMVGKALTAPSAPNPCKAEFPSYCGRWADTVRQGRCAAQARGRGQTGAQVLPALLPSLPHL